MLQIALKYIDQANTNAAAQILSTLGKKSTPTTGSCSSSSGGVHIVEEPSLRDRTSQRKVGTTTGKSTQPSSTSPSSSVDSFAKLATYCSVLTNPSRFSHSEAQHLLVEAVLEPSLPPAAIFFGSLSETSPDIAEAAAKGEEVAPASPLTPASTIGIVGSSSSSIANKMYKKLLLLIHPDKNPHVRAAEAAKRLQELKLRWCSETGTSGAFDDPSSPVAPPSEQSKASFFGQVFTDEDRERNEKDKAAAGFGRSDPRTGGTHQRTGPPNQSNTGSSSSSKSHHASSTVGGTQNLRTFRKKGEVVGDSNKRLAKFNEANKQAQLDSLWSGVKGGAKRGMKLQVDLSSEGVLGKDDTSSTTSGARKRKGSHGSGSSTSRNSQKRPNQRAFLDTNSRKEDPSSSTLDEIDDTGGAPIPPEGHSRSARPGASLHPIPPETTVYDETNFEEEVAKEKQRISDLLVESYDNYEKQRGVLSEEERQLRLEALQNSFSSSAPTDSGSFVVGSHRSDTSTSTKTSLLPSVTTTSTRVSSGTTTSVVTTTTTTIKGSQQGCTGSRLKLPLITNPRSLQASKAESVSSGSERYEDENVRPIEKRPGDDPRRKSASPEISVRVAPRISAGSPFTTGGSRLSSDNSTPSTQSVEGTSLLKAAGLERVAISLGSSKRLFTDSKDTTNDPPALLTQEERKDLNDPIRVGKRSSPASLPQQHHCHPAGSKDEDQIRVGVTPSNSFSFKSMMGNVKISISAERVLQKDD